MDAEKTEKDSGVLSFLNGPSGFLPVRITTSKKNEDNGSGISIGLVLGFNFNLGSAISLGLDGGARACATYSNREGIYGPEGFVNVSVIYRINDSY